MTLLLALLFLAAPVAAQAPDGAELWQHPAYADSLATPLNWIGANEVAYRQWKDEQRAEVRAEVRRDLRHWWTYYRDHHLIPFLLVVGGFSFAYTGWQLYRFTCLLL